MVNLGVKKQLRRYKKIIFEQIKILHGNNVLWQALKRFKISCLRIDRPHLGVNLGSNLLIYIVKQLIFEQTKQLHENHVFLASVETL